MILAHLAGIKVFGTGGLGGVHRGAEVSMDISADLTELGRTPVAVVSSGCKSFLDIPKTLEYLETEGVLVGTFADGRKGHVDYPAFWTRDSGIPSPKVIQNELDAAAMIYAQNQLGLTSGIHFANPIPEKYSIPKAEMDRVIDEAVRTAAAEGFHGSDNTPFILAKIKELTGGSSIPANRALIESNVQRATKVAVELMKLERAHKHPEYRSIPVSSDLTSSLGSSVSAPTPDTGSVAAIGRSTSPIDNLGKVDVLVAGSLAIDLSCDFTPFGSQKAAVSPSVQTSNPATIEQSLGGVGYNVAIAASYVGSTTLFCSVVADDLSGKAALAAVEQEGLETTGIQTLSLSLGVRTAQYIAVNDAKKDLFVAMADMAIMELPDHDLNMEGFWGAIVAQARPNWIVVDGNWSPAVISKWIELGQTVGARIAFEPVSTAKATRLFAGLETNKSSCVIGPSDTVPRSKLDLAAPNELELRSMYSTARENGLFDSPEWWNIINELNLSSAGSRDLLVSVTSPSLVDAGIPQQSIQLLPFIPNLLIKLGPQGVLLTQLLPREDARLTSPDCSPYIISRSDASAGNGNEMVGGVYMRLFPPETILADEDVVSVNGAGDTLLGVVVAGLSNGHNAGKYIKDFIPLAQRASLCTLQGKGGVSPRIRELQASL
ncbi:IdgA domain protein [Talaromyces stipitatus ATCC 10500]|uniref:IdgA domain protein n=1 Tax=Talaromyces stipitatus (strain ATCC 10500 / CBS 375.48 / QM 6759 / NRRL 1006) TaxID=441959 RepID=B8LT43_TALSN|nr:IdgA domain protein [Talaromyces stipitatus ATCC 10500]EED23551.1 IdgA domain protein [Talaromyces stipitatus ATCC 10500]